MQKIMSLLKNKNLKAKDLLAELKSRPTVTLSSEINKQDAEGWTPLCTAVVNRQEADIIKLLITYGADVNLCNKLAWTPLVIACYKGCSPDVVRLLVDSGADISFVDDNGWSTFVFAVRGGNFENIKTLLGAGADINAGDGDWTPLMIMIFSREWSEEQIGFMLENGANPDFQDNEGVTPLMIACEHGTPELVKLLIKYDADLSVANKKSETVFHYLAKNEKHQKQILDIILKHSEVKLMTR